MRDNNKTTDKDDIDVENSHELKTMRESYERGELSRAEFMQGAMATGLSTVAATDYVNASFDINAATPKKGGRIRWAANQHGPDDNNDPALYTSNPDDPRGRAHFNNLLQFNDDMTVRPELVEEWSANADNTEYTFKLRKGVEWHDGTPLSIDDVIYTMNRHLGEDSISTASGLVADVTGWIKVDSHTLRAELSVPNPDLPQIIATTSFKIIKNDAENIDGYFDLPVGTGPFICKEFTPGGRAVHVRNENYWREPAHLDEIETFGISDGNARVDALLNGDIELLMTVPPQAYDRIAESDHAELFVQEAVSYHNLVLMQDRHPGDNTDFVLALKFLMNRDKVVTSFLRGNGVLGNDQPISTQYAEYCPDIPQRPYDLDQAAFHWKKSGLSTDDLLPLYFADTDPGVVDTCVMIQQESEKIGMNLPAEQVSTDGYWNLYPQHHPVVATGWDMRPTANMMYSDVFAARSPNNESNWQNERFNQLLGLLRREKDQSVQAEMHREMQQLIRDDCAMPIPAFRNLIDGKAKSVKGVPGMPLGALGDHSWPEFVWLEDA